MAAPKKVEISHRTIIFIALFALLLWILFIIREVLLQLFVALLIMAILNPTVKRLQKYKIPRPLGVILLYLLLFSVVGWSLAGILPPLVDQSASFASSLPTYLQSLNLPSFVSDELAREAGTQIGRLPSQAIRVGVSIFNNVLSVLTVLIIALYLLLARDKLDEQLTDFFGKERSKKIVTLVKDLEHKLGGWARAQLILMLVVGMATYLGLLILGVPFAIPLGLLAALLEVVPTLGPTLAAVPAIIVGFNESTVTGFAVLALAFLVQQLENYLLVPKVMQKSAGVSPVVTLLALVIGFKLAGIVGAVLSVPVVITIKVISKHYININAAKD